MRTCIGLTGLVTVVLAAGRAMAGVGFVEDFSTDPIASGRWTVMDGDASRFVYDGPGKALIAHYDTALPTARLVRSVGASAAANGWSRFTVEFEIRSNGFYADPDGLAQIAFGLMNHATTGSDRTSFGANSYDLFSVDYFPNVSLDYGGPTLSPTIITSDPGTSFWDAVKFEWGPETKLDDEGESPLPLDTRLTAEVSYAGCAGVGHATIRILREGAALPINAVGASNAFGGADGDPTTIVTTVNDAAFTFDTFALLLWQDVWAVGSSVVADVAFYRVSVDVRPPADFDHNGGVDLLDFASFRTCFNGANRPAGAQCVVDADFDEDGDVDLIDFAVFRECFSGTGNSAPAGCQ